MKEKPGWFAHLAKNRPDAPKDEPEPIKQAQAIAEAKLGPQVHQYEKRTDDSTQAVPRQGELTFVPWMPDVEFKPAKRTFIWEDSVHEESFQLKAAAKLDGMIRAGLLHMLGDGKTIESYQFDLTHLSIAREEILPIMLHRDMVPVMFHPTATGPTGGDLSDTRWQVMQRRNDPQYGKYLVPDDRVIGVEIAGESRCYPVTVMTVHEIANDALGGVPIAVTYNWPCDSVVVFDRRLDGKTLEFAVSGLIYNCNVLMYDVHREAASGKPIIRGENLFSQLLARGVSGVYAEKTLTIISASLTNWREWSKSHPQTTVLDRDLKLAKRYEDATPTSYFLDPKPLRPVKPSPAPPPDGMPLKTPVVIVEIAGDAGSRRVFPIPAMDRNADKDGVWSSQVGDLPIRFHFDRRTQTATVQADSPNQVMVMYAFWFAWYAMHPEDQVVVR